MWIALTGGFFSVVEDQQDPERKRLIIRARHRGDIGRVFGKKLKERGEKIYRSPNRDYAYRAFMSKEDFAHEIAQAILEISYGNFKATVKDSQLSELYNEIWYAGLRSQEREEELRIKPVVWNPREQGDEPDSPKPRGVRRF